MSADAELKIRFAVAYSDASVDRAEYLTFAEGLEERGFDTMWLSDTPLAPGVDPLVALALAAGRTERLRLGTNVVAPGLNPLLLARSLAHLDRLSGGRLLLAFMPGLGWPEERAALGITGVDRIRRMQKTIELCRAWWAGEAVDDQIGQFDYGGVTVEATPLQEPLEIWLGGNGPRATQLAATHGDGWLGARASPEQAAESMRTIARLAEEAGRSIDEDHYGVSVPYSRVELADDVVAEAMQSTDARREDIVAIGGLALQELLLRYIDGGLTKFVLRPLSVEDGWNVELDFLAERVLPLQN